jgi:uncharacterized protein DUF2190
MTNRTYQPVQSITVKATGDLTRCRFVDYTGCLCSANERSVGVTEFNWTSGDVAQVITLGVAVVETDGAINAGASVTASTDGKAKAVASTEPVNGRALDTVSGAGFIRIKLVP